MMFYFSGMLQANSELHITSYKEFCEILLTVSIVNNMFKNSPTNYFKLKKTWGMKQEMKLETFTLSFFRVTISISLL